MRKSLFYTVPRLAGLILFTLGVSQLLHASDWKVSDLFVGANGQYKAYRVDFTQNPPTFTLLDTLSDGLGGAVSGCTSDNTYHLFTTNFTNTKVIRRAIGDPHAVIQTINDSNGGITSGSESIVIDGLGNLYTGHADGSGVIKYNPAGSLVQTFPVAAENQGSDWIDLSADGNTLFYTSRGQLIKRYDLVNNLQLADFANLGNQGGSGAIAYALRVLPSGEVLAADGIEIRRVNSSSVITQTYDVKNSSTCPNGACVNENDLQTITLDPNGTSFWAGDATSHNIYRFNLTSGAIEAGPFNVGGSGPSGLCAYSGFSLAQPAVTPLTDTVNPGTPADGTASFTQGGQTLMVTVNGLAAASSVNAQFSTINPTAGDGKSDPTASFPCTKTEAGGTKCGVWQVDIIPDPPSGATYDLKIVAPSSTTVNANTRLLRDESQDITVGVFNADPIGQSPRRSVYSLNQTAGFNAGCFYVSPLPGTTFNFGRTIPVKIQCNTLPRGVKMSDFTWTLRIVQFVSGAVPHDLTFQFTGGTPNNPTNLYRCTTNACTINLDTSSVPTGNFLFTTFAAPESSTTPQAFSAQISIQ